MVDSLFDVRGKVALVTGGTRGIGLMIARGFVQAGVRTYISSRRADACRDVAVELSQWGECVPVPGDCATEQGCRDLAAAVTTRDAAVHVLVNNAGATWGAPLDEHDAASWNRVLNLNVQGVFHMTKFMLPALRAAASAGDPGRVINIGSIEGTQLPVLETYSYSASKAAVHQLTRHLAKNLGPDVTVNSIAPGPFESKMMAATLSAFGDQIAASAPLKRIGTPEDMAGTAIFLAARAGAYLTGAIIPVDGGLGTTR
jgi:NAD(P)-dependent dehydrogenase (short-subunit alcohol dehydrogenase family)